MSARYAQNAPRIHNSYEARTDDEGKFHIDRVKPGKYQASRMARVAMQAGMWSSQVRQYTVIQVKAGETAAVQIGGVGRAVVGRIELPPELAGRKDLFSDGNLSTKVEFPKVSVPEDVQAEGPPAVQKWYAEWIKTDAGKAHQEAFRKIQENMHHYSLSMEKDGTFRAEDVVAGTYELYITMSSVAGERPGGDTNQIGLGTIEIVVPEIPGGMSDQPLDAGAVKVRFMKPPTVNEPAPPLTLQTLEGKETSLDSFKGKHVILVFWYMGEMQKKDADGLNAAFDMVKDNPNVAMLGIRYMDPSNSTSALKKYLEKHPVPWTQMLLRPANPRDGMGGYRIRTWPGIYVIGPDGILLAKDVPADQLKGKLQPLIKK
jgi:hypothetical protein